MQLLRQPLQTKLSATRTRSTSAAGLGPALHCGATTGRSTCPQTDLAKQTGYCGEEFTRSGYGPDRGRPGGDVAPRHAMENDWEGPFQLCSVLYRKLCAQSSYLSSISRGCSRKKNGHTGPIRVKSVRFGSLKALIGAFRSILILRCLRYGTNSLGLRHDLCRG